jgi:hypothetical protein
MRRSNLFLLFSTKNHDNSVVKDVPNEMFNEIFYSTFNG